MQLKTILQIGQIYYNHYYEKFIEAIKLKCGYDDNIHHGTLVV